MLYKTIVLELIQEQPALHERLRTSRTLLPTMNSYASELKTSHEAWQKAAHPGEAGLRPEADSQPSPGDRLGGIGGAFALRLGSGRNGAAFARRDNELPPPSYAARVRASRGQPRLPMFGDQARRKPPAGEPEPLPNATSVAPPPDTARPPAQPSLPSHPHALTLPSAPGIAGVEKAKARDILDAIRILQTIEREQRPASPQERQTLARFGGFGAVALSFFPHAVTGRYKDAGWQSLGEELKSLLPGGI